VSARLERDYFEALYTEREDPWDFETSAYEAAKYAATVEALGDRRYGRAIEAGCSIGVLTELLAARCDALEAVDVSVRAVERARARLAGVPHVRVERRTLPEEMPAGPFDLIVCSEVLYYWSRDLLLAALPPMIAALAPGGSLLAVHWRPETRTYPLLGDEVHDLLAERLGRLDHALSRTAREYRLDRWDVPR
jgi:SAM-dependent methyltransferase